jgi:hypothetical protein
MMWALEYLGDFFLAREICYRWEIVPKYSFSSEESLELIYLGKKRNDSVSDGDMRRLGRIPKEDYPRAILTEKNEVLKEYMRIILQGGAHGSTTG